MKLFFGLLIFLVGGLLLWHYCRRAQHIHYDKNTHISFILFDFDGVIADSFDTAVTICNQLSDEYGSTTITPEQCLHLRHMPMKDIITKQLKIAWYRIPFFHKRLLTLFEQHILNVPLVAGMDTVLKQLKQQDYRLGIISSNGEQSIRRFLQHHDLNIFDTVYGDSSLFGKHHVINRFLNKCNLHQRDVIYIGDEVRDIQAAQKSGVRIIAVSWGFNTREALLTQQPDHIVSHPSELIPTIHSYGMSHNRGLHSVLNQALRTLL